LTEAFHILGRRPNQKIYIFGRANQAMKTHGCCADKNVL